MFAVVRDSLWTSVPIALFVFVLLNGKSVLLAYHDFCRHGAVRGMMITK